MTPSLIHTQYLCCSFNEKAAVTKNGDGSVSIQLGHAVEFRCNRPEDFEALIKVAERALALIKE